mgnify:CR=1 FL=1
MKRVLKRVLKWIGIGAAGLVAVVLLVVVVAAFLGGRRVGRTNTDADWVRALRHGVGQDGRPLAIMPSRLYANFDAADLGALVAYLKHLPPVDRELSPTEFWLLGRVLFGLGVIDNFFTVEQIAHDRPLPTVLDRAPTPAYGAYVASTSCIECHGDDLRGGRHPAPGGPEAPGLDAVADWPLDLFATTLQTGVTPAGRRLDPELMPWTSTQHLDSVEVAALHACIQTLKKAPAATGR